MIALERVSVRLGGQLVLPGVDLDVPAGRRTALLGPSGSGKSTILRLVIGLCAPSAGRVVVMGEEMTARSAPRLRRRIGYVIQEGGLFPHLSARANVTLMARHLGWDAARMAARVRELAELVRLPEAALTRSPLELSGGQRQRVALMRALMLDPELLLLAGGAVVQRGTAAELRDSPASPFVTEFVSAQRMLHEGNAP